MEQEKQTKRYTMLYDCAEIFTASLLVISLIFTLLFRMVDVDGSSMQTTLFDRERLILSCLPYTPERGDIVVISRGEESSLLIKRVIGLPGDTVAIEPESGTVLLNGEKLAEPYVHVPTAVEQMEGEVTVPAGMVFVMGDNRAAGCSLDSRTFGCVAQERLLGKVVYRLLPLDRIGGLYDKS